MRINLKKKIALIVALMTMLVFVVNTNPIKTKAADVSVVISISAANVSVGDTVSVTVSVSGGSLSAYTLYVGYNSGVLQYVSCSGSALGNGGGGSVTISGTGSSSATITFKAIASGTAGVSTSGSEFYSIDGTALSVSHAGVNISVSDTSQQPTNEQSTTEQPTTEKPSTTEKQDTTEEKKSDNSNLVAISVEPGELDKEFRYDITEYTVKVPKDTTSIKVTPEKEDSTAKVTIEGADDLQPGINTVKITVVAENGYTKIYTLEVIVGDLLEDLVIDLEGKQYVIAIDDAGLEVPEGFTPITLPYKEFEIPAYQSPNELLAIVCLQEKTEEVAEETAEDAEDAEDSEAGEEDEPEEVPVNAAWYIYDVQTDTFTLYEELSSNNTHFVIRPIPEGTVIPEGYAEVEISIQDKMVQAFHSIYATDENMYLVYAMNVNGEEGFYLYDALEKTFMRYAPEKLPEPEVSTVTDTPAPVVVQKKEKGFFTKPVLAFLLILCLAGMIILTAFMVAAVVKKRQLKEELELAESMVEQLVADNGADKVGAIKPSLDDNTANDDTQPTSEEAEASETENEEIAKEPVEEITAEQKVVVDKAKEMAASILGNMHEEKELTATAKGETEEFYVESIPEISLENYAETSKQIQEKINDQYDAQLDSAFTQTDDQ